MPTPAGKPLWSQASPTHTENSQDEEYEQILNELFSDKNCSVTATSSGLDSTATFEDSPAATTSKISTVKEHTRLPAHLSYAGTIRGFSVYLKPAVFPKDTGTQTEEEATNSIRRINPRSSPEW